MLNNEGTLKSELKGRSPIELTFQLGAELDGGTLRYLKTERNDKGIVAPLAHYNVSVRNSSSQFEIFWYVGTDSRALVRTEDDEQGIYSHEVALAEPSKMLEGVLIDGCGVTQPETVSERDNLYDVIVRLLSTAPFDYSRNEAPLYGLTAERKVVQALKNVKSPQFKWNTQMTLWECLVQIGAVVDSIPRLTNSDNYTIVTFDFINAFDNEVETIRDEATNTIGENIAEGQYNTRLRSIVENLMEN